MWPRQDLQPYRQESFLVSIPSHMTKLHDAASHAVYGADGLPARLLSSSLLGSLNALAFCPHRTGRVVVLCSASEEAMVSTYRP